MDSKDKEERKLKKVKIGLMRNPKFALWSGVMMIGKTSVVDDPRIPTACTNGRDEFYSRDLVSAMSERELAFIVLHENLHKAFRHLTTWRKLYEAEPMLANMACDYVINLMLVDMDPHEQWIAFPKKNGERYGLYDAKYRGLHTKQVYDLLKQEQQQGGGSGSGSEGFDDHDWDGAQQLDAEQRKQLEREIDQALRQGQAQHAKLNGDGAGNMNRELGELLHPQVDWKDALREFVRATCVGMDTSSWRRPNRRFIGSDVYLPSMISERVGKLVVGVDTSGSIGGPELAKFLSEVKSIAEDVKPELLDLLYWDTVVAGAEPYTEVNMGDLVRSTKPRGGGGTDPRCVIKWLRDFKVEPQCIIMLTDGYVGDWGNDWPAPVLWVIVNSGKDITAPNGKTIRINS